MTFLNDPEFVALKNTPDARMKELTKEGFRVRCRQAEIITHEEESTMWEKGVLGDKTQLSEITLGDKSN